MHIVACKIANALLSRNTLSTSFAAKERVHMCVYGVSWPVPPGRDGASHIE